MWAYSASSKWFCARLTWHAWQGVFRPTPLSFHNLCCWCIAHLEDDAVGIAALANKSVACAGLSRLGWGRLIDLRVLRHAQALAQPKLTARQAGLRCGIPVRARLASGHTMAAGCPLADGGNHKCQDGGHIQAEEGGTWQCTMALGTVSTRVLHTVRT